MPTKEQTGKSQPAPAEAERTRCQCCDKGKIWESDWTGSQHELDCTECMGTGIVQDKTAVERSAAERELIAAAKACALGLETAAECVEITQSAADNFARTAHRLRVKIAAWEAKR